MDKEFSVKKLFIRILLLLPVIYIVFGWYIGLNYAIKPAIFGPYPDIPVVIRTSILGSSVKDISGADSVVMVSLPGRNHNQDKSAVYSKIKGYFELPGRWYFSFPMNRTGFLLTGSYSRATAREFNNPERGLGYFSLDELYQFLKLTNRHKDISRLMPYFFPAKLEEKYPWLYSESVLLSSVMGSVFSDNMVPYDMLGVFGIFILFIALSIRSFRLWMYYLYWVFAYWLARIGFHDPVLAFSKAGQNVILWSFWNGFIQKEGRVFLIIAMGLSVILFGILGLVYLFKHVLPRKKREIEDFLKVDKDSHKRKELCIEDVEFKEIHYNINKKFSRYACTNKYFLGVSDDKKDVVVDEHMLNHHLHVLGPTGSGKTSMVILPLSKQAIDKGRGCCFIDFKGDEVFKRYVQQKARENKKNFYYFSIDPKENSCGYNPLFSGDIHSKVDRIMTALELIYSGPAGFYSNVQAMTFVELLKEMTKDNSEINFLTVKKALEDPSFLERTKVDSHEVKGLLAAISWIAGLDVINRDELDLGQVIKNGDVVFFALKSQVNTRLAEAIGRMLIIDLKSQAVGRQETDPPYFIFIDEFQNLACSHFIDVISKVRSANFCLVLSNQSKGNLANVSAAFENAVFTNTAAKIIFMQEDPMDAKFWSDKTGQTTYQDKNILQLDTMAADNSAVKLDGLRSSRGTIRTAAKNYITENIFLRLPFSKSVIFLRGELACMTNHEFLFDKQERDRIVSIPFDYTTNNQKERPIC